MIKALSNEDLKKNLLAKGRLWIWGYVVPFIVLLVVFIKMASAAENQLFSIRAFDNAFFLALAVLLFPLNLALESGKWYLIAKSISDINFTKSVKIVLAGKSLNLISPLGLGEVLVKYLHVEKEQKSHSYGMILLDRLSSMVPTLIFGMVSLVFLLNQGHQYLSNLLYFFIGLGVVLFVLIWFFYAKLTVLLLKYREYITALLNLSFLDFTSIIGLSFLRYFIFSVQFYCVLMWVGIVLDPKVLMLGIFWVFFVKTIIPDFTVFGDLAKRELSAVTFFMLFLPSMEGVMFANVVIWLINIIFPSLLGLFFVNELKKLAL